MSYLSGINNAIEYIEAHLTDFLDYDNVYKTAGMSKSSFQKFFVCITDMPLSEYIRKRKLQCAAQELSTADTTVTDVSVKYGYDSLSAFSRAMHAYAGKTPAQIVTSGVNTVFPKLHLEVSVNQGALVMNEKQIVRIEEHKNEKVVFIDVDCINPETEAWGQMSKWCVQNIPDRTARRFVGLAPKGHHPNGENHQNAEEHTSHPYRAMMFLLDSEIQEIEKLGKNDYKGLSVMDAPKGLFLVNDVALDQYDENGVMDMALSMIKASEAFVEFMKTSEIYEFDCKQGIFYEEHIFSEKWFNNGGTPDAFKMWVPILKK